VTTGTLSAPGGGLASLLRDSPTFGPIITAGLEAQGLMPGTTLFEQFLRDAQTVVDSGDPLNYIAAAAVSHPIHVQQIVGSDTSPPDQVVPNSATQRLIDAAGLVRIPAPATPRAVVNPMGHRAYVNFIRGSHGSLIDQTAGLNVTMEMQGEAITFTGAPVPPIPNVLPPPGFPPTTPGTAILISNPTVIQP
jgi:hypothetical protein